MRELYLGMLSGTSIDGVDVVLAELDDSTCAVRHAATIEFPATLLKRLQQIVTVPETSLKELGALDHALGRFFARCALDTIAEAGVARSAVVAIGHHGQTIFHEPVGAEPFTLQIGDPNIVAAETGLTTVADFRRMDMALGGQGAPLMPAFHAWCFAERSEPRAVVNIGGIANVTAMAVDAPVIGFDTGPGNTLLDLWIRRSKGERFDRDGAWAASGRVHEDLLASFATEPYFTAPAPKSTGRELFHMAWLDAHLGRFPQLAPADVQATLAELTAATITAGIEQVLPDCSRIVVCGGGAHNAELLRRIASRSGIAVVTTSDFGVAPDWVEGAGFAWLARARLREAQGNVPTVTGARRKAVLGAVYCGAAP